MRAPELRMAGLIALMCSPLVGCGGTDGHQTADLDSLPEGVLREVWSIGGGQDEGGVVLTGVHSAVIQDDGEVVILDRMDATVHRVSADGQGRLRLGQRGQGPGEVMMPIAAGVGPAGAIWVLDMQLQRINWYDPTGAFRGTWPVAPVTLDADADMAVAIAALEDGRVLGRAVPPPGQARSTIPIVLGDSIGNWSAHGKVEGRRTPVARVVTEQGLPMEFPRSATLDHEPIYTVRPGGRTFSIVDRSPAVGHGEARFHIYRFRSDGEPLGAATVSYMPTAVSDSVRALVRETIRLILERQAQVNASLVLPSLSAVEQAMALPAFFPPVLSAFEDEEGYWIVRESGPSPMIERYGLEGTPVGRLRLDGQSGRVIGARGSQILLARNDSLGVPRVTLYSVLWGALGPGQQ